MPISNEGDHSHSQAVHMAGIIMKSHEKLPLTKEEQEELEAWLGNSEANRQLFESLKDREEVAGELEALLRYDEEKAVAAVFRSLGGRPPSAIKRVKLMTRWISVAASLLLLAGATWWFFIRRPVTGQEGLYNTVATPRGTQKHVRLPDGSEVWLNAASSITYPASFTGNTREATVTGEAYFSVAKDRAKPFLVTANAMKIQVVGTEFNVMAYNEEAAIRTTLVEGIVKAAKIDSNAQKQEWTLQPGQQAVLVDGADTLRIEKVNLEEVTAWRQGKFHCQETSMSAIMRQVARWYDVKVEYRGAAASIKFSGDLSRKDSVEELLDMLADTRNVHFEIKEGKTIIVIPGPRPR